MIDNNYHQPSVHSVELLASKPVIVSSPVRSGYLSARDALALSQCCKAFHREVYEVDVRNLIKSTVGFISLFGPWTHVKVNGNTTVKQLSHALGEKLGKDVTGVKFQLPSIAEGFVDPREEPIAGIRVIDVAPKAYSIYKYKFDRNICILAT